MNKEDLKAKIANVRGLSDGSISDMGERCMTPVASNDVAVAAPSLKTRFEPTLSQ